MRLPEERRQKEQVAQIYTGFKENPRIFFKNFLNPVYVLDKRNEA